ncbi:heat-inducible transcriptional repressor HrcA [Virgibacillus sp. 179-BFC.A HS]|uniref:Heat-inducible transcription repressor HrcA n=1 Tax=Tigheibacillus jepli TaxID=3035914 RepID=A0ABU5CGR1_9BACI|nr:heat-inducible transcriptional repressor HrcA [Virgibacillus sp. 179-BFC.A HS]MDY0405523.1 heat-inducible transcriptional repressor HrcA [Virgibacillus sp. 179-BFC.A HS]
MLTKRQLLILQVIIDDFIETAHPIGSRAISKKDNIDFSAATIRNEMADLEEMGYLEKTHTSSGRIPSEKGYRYYVDHIIVPNLKSSDLSIMKHIVKDGFFEVEKVVQKAAEVLSHLTSYTSIILGPEIVETRLKQLHIVTLSENTAVAILITDTGHVQHRSFTIPAEIKASDLEKMINMLNERLRGVPLIQLHDILEREIYSLMRMYLDDYQQAYEYLTAAFFKEQPARLYIGGKANMLMQPEFNDLDKIRAFYSIIEDEDEVAGLLKNASQGVGISIGHENKVDAFKDLSLITATYQIGEGQMGTIGLVGPTRMEYKKVITLLSALSNEMTETLYLWYKSNDEKRKLDK